MTVAQVFAWYVAHELRRYSPKALKERRRVWDKFAAYVGAKPVAECNAAMLLDFISTEKGLKSNWSRKRFAATINRPMNEAAQLGLIPRNPFRGLRIPEGPQGRDWTPQEYAEVLRLASPEFRRFVVFLRYSGCRPGEARELEWQHVRDDLGVLVKVEHKTAYTGCGPRRIHYNSVLVKLLAWLRRHSQSRYVFTNSNGNQWTTEALVKALQRIRVKAGLDGSTKLHGCRHTFATHALVNGVDLATLAELLGHRSTKSTERYLHLAHQRSHLNAAMERAIGKTG